MPRLTGRVIVVTAAAAATARMLAEEGAAVVLVGTGPDAGETAAEIKEAGGRAVVFAGDLDVSDDRAALAEMVEELFPARDA
ncbi:MAG: SDR family NAD(P)-dependent oxidoreductase [Actinobacteria bacterium]|nr:SDR family NAD(P)-dependent oxidoreductase [Actinomycetota bacterium]